MSIDELLNTVKSEGLTMPVLYGEGKRATDAVVLEREANVWKVFVVNERGGVINSTIKTFDNESDALRHVLLKLRQVYQINTPTDQLRYTHAVQSNGIGRRALTNKPSSYPDQIRHALRLLNGTGFWAWSLWRIPGSVSATENIPFSEEYIQCVGSADAMTIEVRTLDPDDNITPYRFIIGKPGDYSAEPSEEVAFGAGRRTTKLYPNELFTADEAATIVYTYFETGGVTRFYNLRELDDTVERITTQKDLSPISEEEFVSSVTLKYISQAIYVYLGKGSAPHPQKDEAAVRKLVSNHKKAADALVAKTKTIVEGCLSVEVDWSTHSLSEGGDEARRVMAARYPELNDDALNALRWMFAYNWR